MHADPASPPAPLPLLNAAMLLRALLRRPRRTSGARTPRTLFHLERIDPDLLRRYRDTLGFGADGMPLTWWYLAVQRAQVATLLEPAFPFRLAGSVHSANTLTLVGTPDAELPLRLATSVGIRPPADNGAVYADLETTGSQQGLPVFVCRSSYLVVRGERRTRTGAGRKPVHADPGLPAVASWHLGPASGRQYAALSGDWNPIHLWSWSARLMGMRRPVIHGMHTLARVCAELERVAGRPVVGLDSRFTAPAALGSELTLCADLDGGAFAVVAAGRTVAAGTFQLGGAAA